MCCDCMIAWCCVVWLSVKWVHWQSQTKIERGQHTGVIVWCGEWWVCRKKSGGMVDWKGGKDGVKDTVTQKPKDALFPQTTFPLLFPFPKLFPFPDSLLLCHHPLSITKSTSFFMLNTYVHPQWVQIQTNTTLNPFRHVFLMSIFSFTSSFLYKSFSFDYYSITTITYSLNNTHSL